jgi:cell division protein FtsA
MVTIRERSDEADSEPLQITKAALIAVIRQRLEHLTTEIQAALKELRFEGPVNRQVVLTGGGAELKGVADYAQQALGRSVRVGRPRGLTGLPEAHAGPGFATLAGLAFFAADDPIDLRGLVPQAQTVTRARGMGAIRRLIQAARANY